MGCGQSKPEPPPDEPPPVVVEPIGGQERPENPLVPLLVAATGEGSVRYNMIRKSLELKEYIVCDRQAITLLSKTMGTPIAPAIAVYTGAGTFACKIKKSVVNEAEAKVNAGTLGEKNPTYLVYKKLVADGTQLKESASSATSRLLKGDVMGGLKAGMSIAQSAVASGAHMVNLDSDSDIVATVMRTAGTSGQPGATWMIIAGKVLSEQKVVGPPPNVLYTLTEDASGNGSWEVRNVGGTLVGRGGLDWEWRPPQDVAVVPEGAQFASRLIEVGPGADTALILAATFAIDDFDNNVYAGQSTDVAVEFGRGLKTAQAKMDEVLSKLPIPAQSQSQSQRV
mmetsp:Transcript_4214/g.10857  ORF Transcript_4214/g.10857 Transcript_4214/m.10857 type:complete len:339 (-) Transcript_4214:213-1229(-)